ncbi:hypothetical protein V6N11_009854 [Hibiscus sabdariffa]|uniref:Calcineurin B-like protein n=1 Tax=Hibiscus sabdariffa TaxID=183260 RepID=A0ABR1ZXH8_9ROSI
MGCFCFKKVKNKPGHNYKDPLILASETPFTVHEVKALYDLYKRLSSSIIKDGLIHKEEFQLAVFRNSSNQNLFADRVFDSFDAKRNGVIEFGEFVRLLSVFHPRAPESDKTAFEGDVVGSARRIGSVTFQRYGGNDSGRGIELC